MNGWFKIQIAQGIQTNSPRNNFLQKENIVHGSFSKSADLELVNHVGEQGLSPDSAILDTGKLVDFCLVEPSEFYATKQLNVTTYCFESGELIEDVKRCLLFKFSKHCQVVFLFSSDLTYCIVLQFEKDLSLGNVIKSIIRISLYNIQQNMDEYSNQTFHYQENPQSPIRSRKRLISIEACLSTSHVLSILLNYEVAHEKVVNIFSVSDWYNGNASIDKVKDVKLPPILTYIRKLSSNQFGDKFIVEDAKCFCIYSTKPGYNDKVEPLKGTNPHITYNVSLKSELLIHDSQNGNSIQIFRIKESAVTDDGLRLLTYNLIWKVTAGELGLYRVHIFTIQSFNETLIFYNQTHSLQVLNPFRKKVVRQLDFDQENLNLLCQSCNVNWSCREVYVKFHDSVNKTNRIKVFSLAPKFSISLLDQCAEKVLTTYSITMLKHKAIPQVFRMKLGYF